MSSNIKLIKFSAYSSMLMRAGSFKKIKSDYDKKQITFSCAANWIDYGKKYRNGGVGDWLECTFAHVHKSFDESSLRYKSGEPLGDIICSILKSDDTKYLTRIPMILTPLLCLFSFNDVHIRLQDKDEGESISFLLGKYLTDLGYAEEDGGYLFITKPNDFINELRRQIPLAVKENLDSAKTLSVNDTYNPIYSIGFKDVDYNTYDKKEFFLGTPTAYNELFWKDKKFEYQSELRLFIPGVTFNQQYPSKDYNYKINELTINLPNFQTYSEIVSAKEYNAMNFLVSKDRKIKISPIIHT